MMRTCGFCLLFFLFLTIDVARVGAQSAPIPTARRGFSIPFEVRPDSSVDPAKEIELLVSKDRGARWHSVGRKPLDGKQFDFQAETDGEYWFAFRTITLSGNTRQSGTGPQIRVLVDATAPVLSLEMKQQASGQMLVHWKANEEHLQGKRPDFAVSIPSFDREKSWKPLNVDTRHQKTSETEIEGGFLFWPENDVSEIELRAILSDVAGNRTEKTFSTKIKPIHRDIEEILQDSMRTNEPRIESPDSPVSMNPSPTPDPSYAPTGPFDGPMVSISPQYYRKPAAPGVPLTPPKPIRIATRNRRERLAGATPIATDEPLLAGKYRPAPSLGPLNDDLSEVSDSTSVAVKTSSPVAKSPKTKTKNAKTESKPIAKTDELSRQLLADMDRFFDGRLGNEFEKTETVAKTRRTTELVGGPALSPSDPLPSQVSPVSPISPASPAPPIPATPHRAVAENRRQAIATESPQAPVVAPGSITGISMSMAEGQARIIVKWNPGDENQGDAQVDVLRGASAQGPWLPIATNLPNTGHYWWFLTKDDLTPFHILVRTRSLNGIRTDVTQTPITIDPKRSVSTP